MSAGDQDYSSGTRDGGPAFPLCASTGDPRDGVSCCSGMSLRDYMATHFAAGMAACRTPVGDMPKYAASAYEFADAMLEARKKK